MKYRRACTVSMNIYYSYGVYLVRLKSRVLEVVMLVLRVERILIVECVYLVFDYSLSSDG